MKENTPLDIYDIRPAQMRNYLSYYGWNFTHNAYQFALSLMKSRNDTKIQEISIQQMQELLSKHNITLENNKLYNANYAYAMIQADFLGSSIPDEKHALLMVKDIIDDVDNEGGNLFRKFYADCVAKAIPLDWSTLL